MSYGDTNFGFQIRTPLFTVNYVVNFFYHNFDVPKLKLERIFFQLLQ